MGRGKSQFTGLAGEYFVAHCLTLRGYHASLTVGNAPNVDVLVASVKGGNLISLQVKTSQNAHRSKRYGHEVWEWDVGVSAIGRRSDSIWYAFVDLREDEQGWDPEVFLVPSLWVDDFVKPEHSRKMYLLKSGAAPLCRERWDMISKFFSSDPNAIQWVRNIPKEAQWER